MHESRAGKAEKCMSRSEETRLIVRAKRGHAEAYRELVEAYKDRLFAFVWRMVRNHHEAEDLVQAAFVKAWESLASYSDQFAFSTWLFTIAYRLCLNRLRKKKALSGETDFTLIGEPDSGVNDTLANSEEARRLRELIWTAVDDLTPTQRAAVLLFYKEGKSCQDIGTALNMPAVTVKSHLHRARERLRTVLRGQLAEDWADVDFQSGSQSG
jgi:RNA polymerase sigma-70 factor (ECF subfamily)